jgi:hypothetical protein
LYVIAFPSSSTATQKLVDGQETDCKRPLLPRLDGALHEAPSNLTTDCPPPIAMQNVADGQEIERRKPTPATFVDVDQEVPL